MKKALPILIASIMVLSLFGCGGSASTGQAGNEKTTSNPTAEPAEEAAAASDPAGQSEATEPETAAIEVTAKEMLQEYDDNEVKADEKYRDKLVTVTGKINDVGKDILDEAYVSVGTGSEYEFITVQCYFSDEEELKKVSDLNKGDDITLTGTCDGMSINILLNDCVIK